MSDVDYDIIARYVGGDMAPAEKKAFEEMLQKDATLQQEVELYREVLIHLQKSLQPSEKETDLRKIIQEESDRHFKPRVKAVPVKPRLLRWIITGTAVAALLIFIIWAPWKLTLFNDYADIRMPLPAARGNQNDSLMQLAGTEFNKHHYQAASIILQKITEQEPDNTFARFYYGVSLVHTGSENAEKELLVIYNGKSLYRYNGAFFIALKYLKGGDKKTAKAWLQKIPPGVQEYNKAQELMRRL